MKSKDQIVLEGLYDQILMNKKTQLEEGWKDWVAAGALGLMGLMGGSAIKQNVDNRIPAENKLKTSLTSQTAELNRNSLLAFSKVTGGGQYNPNSYEDMAKLYIVHNVLGKKAGQGGTDEKTFVDAIKNKLNNVNIQNLTNDGKFNKNEMDRIVGEISSSVPSSDFQPIGKNLNAPKEINKNLKKIPNMTVKI